jgi:hypothetical protein
LTSSAIGDDWRREQALSRFLALLLACWCYATGNFGFLNVFDARREVQIALMLLTVPFAWAVVERPSWLREPVWWLAVVTLVWEIGVRQNTSAFFLFDRMATVFLVALVMSLGLRFSELALSAVIVVCAIFSSMVVVQAAAVWIDGDVLRRFVLGYTTSTAAAPIALGHPLEYLGFTTPGSAPFFGHVFTRFRSFTSEPSVVICAFYAPGLLALTFRPPVRYAAFPILSFAAVLSGAGTAFLSLGLGVAAWFVLTWGRRSPTVLAAAPIALVFCWWFVLARLDIKALLALFSKLVAPLAASLPILDKAVAGYARLSVQVSLLARMREYWLYGAPVGGTGGFLLYLFVSSGVIGLLLACMVSFQILRLAVRVFDVTRGIDRLAAALVFGMWVQVMIFSDFGWITLTGFVVIVLTIRRLEHMLASATMVGG